MTCTSVQSLLQDLGTIVGEELKVVSYKWLARQYSLPANYAKQLLFKFVEQQAGKAKAVYLVSGYLKEDESKHVIRLVDASDLAKYREQFAVQTSIHVHSVMPADTNPITDLARLSAEDTEQARHFYTSIIKENALSNGSADVFAKNACSSISFDTSIVPETDRKARQPQLQESQQQETVGTPSGKAQLSAGAKKTSLSGASKTPQKPAAAAAATPAGTPDAQLGKENGGRSSPVTASQPAAASPAAAAGAAASGAAGGASGKAAARPSGKQQHQQQGTKGKNSLASMWSKVPAKPAGTAKQQQVQSAVVGTKQQEHPSQPEQQPLVAADVRPEPEVESPAAAAKTRQRGRQQLIDDDDDQDEQQQQQPAKRARGRMVIESDEDDDEILAAMEAPTAAAAARPVAAVTKASNAKAASGKAAAKPKPKQNTTATNKKAADTAAAVASAANGVDDLETELLSAIGEDSKPAIAPVAQQKSKQTASKASKKPAAAAAGKGAGKAKSKAQAQQQQQKSNGKADSVSWDDEADADGMEADTFEQQHDSKAAAVVAAAGKKRPTPEPESAAPDGTEAAAKKQKAAAAPAPTAPADKAAGPRIDPVTGEEIWGEEEPAAVKITATAAKPDASKPTAVAGGASGGKSGLSAKAGASGGGNRAAASGAGKASGKGKGKAAAVSGQRGIASFFGGKK